MHAGLSVVKLFGVDMLEQNEWERDSLLMGKNGADGITWVLTRPVRPTKTPFVGAYVHKEKRGPMNCSIYDHGDFCLYCVASSEWDKLAPHVSSGPQTKKKGSSHECMHGSGQWQVRHAVIEVADVIRCCPEAIGFMNEVPHTNVCTVRGNGRSAMQ